MKRIKVEDDAAFTALDGMSLGAVGDNGNLRMVLSRKGHDDIAVELPSKWLHGETGLAAFIRENCRPDKTVPA